MQQSTRKFETGLPLFSGLDLGLILDAQAQIKRNEFHGLTAMVETLGKTGSLKVIRKRSAIWTASDVELKAAEADPKLLPPRYHQRIAGFQVSQRNLR